MTHHREDTTFASVLETLIENGLDGMAEAMSLLMNEAMRLERSRFLGAEPYERSEERRGHANGYKPKQVRSRAGLLDLLVPQTRDVTGGEPFYPTSLERGLRSERALKLAIAEMYVQGVSTRRVEAITRQLCGLDLTSTEVSRAAAELDEMLESWRTRPLDEVPYLILDARYEKVRHGGCVVLCAVLVAVGVDTAGKRSVLGVSVSLSEAEVHWRAFLRSLLERGMHGVRMVTSDDHQGLKAALAATLTAVPWQRCQCHLQRNAVAYVPRVAMRRDVAEAIRAVFNAPDRAEADRQLGLLCDRYRDTAPRLAAWAEQNLPEGLTVMGLPRGHQRRLRTTNGLERLNKEIGRRTRVATLFPNEVSVLRLATAVVMEISEDWETGRIYINMEDD
jgi:transposase-like protein